MWLCGLCLDMLPKTVSACHLMTPSLYTHLCELQVPEHQCVDGASSSVMVWHVWIAIAVRDRNTDCPFPEHLMGRSALSHSGLSRCMPCK